MCRPSQTPHLKMLKIDKDSTVKRGLILIQEEIQKEEQKKENSTLL